MDFKRLDIQWTFKMQSTFSFFFCEDENMRISAVVIISSLLFIVKILPSSASKNGNNTEGNESFIKIAKNFLQNETETSLEDIGKFYAGYRLAFVF